MKVAFLTASASRRAGGLFWSVRSLARHIQAQDVEVRVFAGRDDDSEEDCSAWDSLSLELFKVVGPAAFGFARGLQDRMTTEEADLIHTQGLWMYPSVAAAAWGRRMGKPWMVSPRGMLDPWALGNGRARKRLAGFLYENTHLCGAACLHALSAAEADAFRAYGLTNPIAVIPNGVSLPELPVNPVSPNWAAALPTRARLLLFLGRLHPKKGLSSLIQAWARVASTTDEPWVLVIAGWDQNGYRAELERLVVSLGVDNSIYFVGPQFGDQKIAALQKADAFVLPSYSEGLPMAVLEAWAFGLPVLMTPQCNLPAGFAADAAIRVEAEVESLVRGLKILIGSSSRQLAMMGERGRALVRSDFTWTRAAAQMLDVYRWVVGQGPKPDCVRLD